MIHEITFLRFTTTAPWTETEKHTNTKDIMPIEDNFSDIGLLFHIINPQILAYNRKRVLHNSLGLQYYLPELHEITFHFLQVSSLFTDHWYKSALSLWAVHNFLPQCTVTFMICSRKQADSMLFFPTLVFFRCIEAGIIFTRFAKRKQISCFPSEKGKNPLFASDK